MPEVPGTLARVHSDYSAVLAIRRQCPPRCQALWLSAPRGARHSGLVSWFASISAAADRRQCQRCQVPEVPGTLAWSVGWLAFPQQRIGGSAKGARHSGLVVPEVPGTLAWSIGWLAFPQQRIGGGAQGARHSGLVCWFASIPTAADRRQCQRCQALWLGLLVG